MTEAFVSQNPFIIAVPSSKEVALSTYSPIASAARSVRAEIYHPNSLPINRAAASTTSSVITNNISVSISENNMFPSAAATMSPENNIPVVPIYLNLPTSLSAASPVPELMQSARSTYSPPHSDAHSLQRENKSQMEGALAELAVTQAALITSSLPYAPVTQQIILHDLNMSAKHTLPTSYVNTSPHYSHSVYPPSQVSSLAASFMPAVPQNITATTLPNEQRWSQASTPFAASAKSVIPVASQLEFSPCLAVSDLSARINQGHENNLNLTMSNVSPVDLAPVVNGSARSASVYSYQSSQPQSSYYVHHQLSLRPQQHKLGFIASLPSLNSGSLAQNCATNMGHAHSQESLPNSTAQFHNFNGVAAHNNWLYTASSSSNAQNSLNVTSDATIASEAHFHSYQHGYLESERFMSYSNQSESPIALLPLSLDEYGHPQGIPSHTEISSCASADTASLAYRCEWRGCLLEFDKAALLMHHVSEEHIGRRALGHLSLHCEWGDCRVSARKRDHIISHIRLHVPYWPLTCKLCGRNFKRNPALKRHLRRHMEKSYAP
ncbi:hypothetical protein BDF19DRAFT_422882 [Syncephalis fuscata]|nr:hypothetical protein BDF19DRAFT_422882 [Syncephalis fuscata]